MDMEPARDVDNDSLDTEDDKIHITRAVNTSPGNGEVIICAALYLKLKLNPALQEGNNREKQMARLAELLVPEGSGKRERSFCQHILLKSKSVLQNLVFVKPLQVKLQIDTEDHPKAENTKEIILTESRVEVNVSL
ncbi:hypothetical protein SAY86_024254 [Trapa natans]|uniref:Uncharacterized protein n=1 Tax=Trapa natans TaxID=22666 RepID=A0AAN7RBB4_TRANT|nr:hypothetical protein SAY86_024254 [Trapa natans]